jgi:hypothetical protein
MMMVKFPTRDEPLPYIFRFEYELVEAVPVQYKIWAGFARTQAEFAAMKPRWVARMRDSLHDALWDAMQIIDGRQEIVWEIEGDDGSRLGRQDIVELVRQRRWELTANTNYLRGFKRLYHVDRSEIIWLPEHIASFMKVAPIEMQRALILGLHTGQREGDLLRHVGRF